jgi:peptidoglycan/xylan/chitin deacetylase (PgdA/CDA1 family)
MESRTRAESGRWPGPALGAVSLTFDNLGEAAEEELGLPVTHGDHASVSTALPLVLAELAERQLQATFFVEGVNARTYPVALRSIVAAGHECAYHAWHHENWGRLTAAQERENLSRGLQAMKAIGLEPKGFRPPGGVISDTTLGLLREHGLSYCSPAGDGVGVAETVVLPFSWPQVDAFHVLPEFAALRAHVDGTEGPGGPERVAEAMIASIDHAVAAGDHTTLVLHTALIETERDAVRDVLNHLNLLAREGDAWVARCDEVAAWIEQRPGAFPDAPRLNSTSWMNPS